MIRYIVVYGSEYLVDYGDGWTRWTTNVGDARRFDTRKMADKVKDAVDGEFVMPVMPYSFEFFNTPEAER